MPFFARFLFFLSVAWSLVQATSVMAQAVPSKPEADIVLGPNSFALSDYYTISFRLRGAPLERYSDFPDLEGFKKSGKSSTTTTRIVNGRTSVELTITQRYAAYDEGEYVVKPFSITINGLTVRSAGATLMVGPQAPAPTPLAGSNPLQGVGSLDQLFGKPKPQDYVEPKDYAFLLLLPDKTSVYVGEGVHVGLYFYLAPSDQGLLDFHNFPVQLPAILRQLRQRTAWEEPFDEQEILPESVTMGGKPFLRYRLYEAMFYPLNTTPLMFPEVSLQMVKYRLAKNPTEGLDNRLEGYKTYHTNVRLVAVRPLPPHPLRDQVAVGDYQLRESIDRTVFRTGQAFKYSFTVEGEGNLAAMNGPGLVARPNVEIYGPDVEQELTRQNGRVGGRKSFRYRLVAQRAGTIPFDSLFQVVVFNPTTAHYDTLRSELKPDVKGPVRTTSSFGLHPDDTFYAEALASADATLQPLDEYHDVRRYANLILVVLLGAAGFGWWLGKKG
jgi:hypothetical protein